VCGVSRLIVPALLAGLVAATLSNRAPVGWAVAVAVGAALSLWGRRGRGGRRCGAAPDEAATFRDYPPGYKGLQDVTGTTEEAAAG